MFKNLIDAQLSKEDEDLAVQKVRELEGLFPFLVNITPEERKRMPHMGDKMLGFAEGTLIYGREYPALIPPFRSADAFQRDLDLLRQLRRVLGVLEPFIDMLRGTYMQVGAEAYASARDIYNMAKRAAKSAVPGTDVIVKDLGELYKKQYVKANEPQPEPEPEAGPAPGSV